MIVKENEQSVNSHVEILHQVQIADGKREYVADPIDTSLGMLFEL